MGRHRRWIRAAALGSAASLILGLGLLDTAASASAAGGGKHQGPAHAQKAPVASHRVAPIAPKAPRAAKAAPAIGASPMLAALPSRTFTVNSNADTHDANPGDGSCADSGGACTLRAAIEEANADAGSTQINVPAGMTILLDSSLGALAPTASMFIAGGGSTTVIDGQNATQVLNIDDSTTNPAVAISNLTVQNGNGSDGGNVYTGHAAVTLTNVSVKGGQATYGAGTYSGYYGTLWLVNSTVDSNAASSEGGGLYLDGSAFITGSTISNNHSGSYGGGIYISSGQVTMTGSPGRGPPAVGVQTRKWEDEHGHEAPPAHSGAGCPQGP